MATVNFYSKAIISLPGTGNITIGDISTPFTITLDASAPDVHVVRKVLADNEETQLVTIGSGASDDIPDFKFAAFYCSVDTTLGFGGDADADNSTVKVDGGSYFYLTSDKIKEYISGVEGRVDQLTPDTDIISVWAGNDSGSTGYVQAWFAR